MSLEKQVVDYYKQVLYAFFNRYSDEYGYCLVGGTAIKLQLENSENINSLDADIHIWDKHHPNKTFDEKIVYMNRVKEKLQNHFEEDFKGFGNHTYKYYRYLPETQTKPLDIDVRLDMVTKSYVMIKITIFGFELSDVVYHYHQSYEYFDYKGLNILKIKPLFEAQIEVFAQNLSRYYKTEYKDLRENSPLPRPVRVERIQELVINSIGENLTGDEFLERYFITPNQYVILEKSKYKGAAPFNAGKIKKRYVTMIARIPKTYNRVKLIVQSYYRPDINVFPAFVESGASCITLRYANNASGDTIYAEEKDKNYCISRTIVGIYNKDKINLANTVDDVWRRVTDISSIDTNISHRDKLEIEKFWNKINFKAKINTTEEAIIDIWTSGKSSLITSVLRNYYTHRKFGIPWEWDPMIKTYIECLQRLCLSQALPKEIIDLSNNNSKDVMDVWKASRNIIFVDGKTTANFKVGDSVLQYMFHSSTINQTINLVNFSSYQVGACVYILELDENFPGFYIGRDGRFQYPNEYEFLLPFGCTFEIKEVIDGHYIAESSGTKSPIFYQLKTYRVKVIPPNMADIDFLQIGTVKENNIVILQDNKPDDDKNVVHQVLDIKKGKIVTKEVQLPIPTTYLDLIKEVSIFTKNFIINSIYSQLTIQNVMEVARMFMNVISNCLFFVSQWAKYAIVAVYNFLMDFVFFGLWNDIKSAMEAIATTSQRYTLKLLTIAIEKGIKLLTSAQVWVNAKSEL